MLEGWEWIIIGIVVVVIILWGPSKIPEFAKALGRAKGEFDNASKEFQNAAQTTANTPSATSNTKVIKSKDEILLETAKNLGIATDGKTREEIAAEVSEKVKNLSATNS